MITVTNYYQHLKYLKIPKTQKNIWNGMEFVDRVTSKGKSWEEYKKVDWVRELVNTFMRELNRYISDHPDSWNAAAASRGNELFRKAGSKNPTESQTKVKTKSARTQVSKHQQKGAKVPRVKEEIKQIKRFLLMEGEEKTFREIRLYLNSLQRSITDKRIRKTSPYAKEIMEIQTSIIKLLEENPGNTSTTMYLSDQKREHLLKIVGVQEELLSVKIIRQYIELHGRTISNKQVQTLYNRIVRGVNKHQISLKDKYWPQIQKLMFFLKAFLVKNGNSGSLVINSSTLQGIASLRPRRVTKRKTRTPRAKRRGSKGLNGATDDSDLFDEPPRNAILSAASLANMEYETLGFTGKWLDLIGDPSPGFTALVFGQPKVGKSTLCIDFAAYLAREKGAVLYVSREEGFTPTFQEKLKAAQAFLPNLMISDHIPSNLSRFKFVFIDSITRLGLSADQLEELERKYPRISFIYVAQVTKAGQARGTNEYLHNADVIIEVPERGRAIQYGRFNQGGEMQIFK